jgi:tryptophan synthase alpha subunit
MGNRIDERLAELRESGRKGLMTHVVVGYPSLPATGELVRAMAEAGADFVELQIPFADALADGPTIQLACEKSIERGTTVRDAFALAGELATEVSVPLLFMAYANTVHRYGVDRFCADAAAAGLAGLIVPDLPLEAAEHEGYLAACRRHGLHNVATFGPTSTAERLMKNAAVTSGFVYCMAREGVTGAHLDLAPGVQDYLARVREHMVVPMAVGFGISNRERLEKVLPHCDIAVVGSALIDRIDSLGTDAGSEDLAEATKDFLATLVPGLTGVR